MRHGHQPNVKLVNLKCSFKYTYQVTELSLLTLLTKYASYICISRFETIFNINLL